MTAKFMLYFVVTMIVIWAMQSVNINSLFKNNCNPLQARIMYFLMGLSMIYLITNFILDVVSSVKIL